MLDLVDWRTVDGAVYTASERELTVRVARKMATLSNEAHLEGLVIANIGVLWGASLHCLRAGAPNTPIFGIDIDLVTYKVIGDPQAVLIEGDSRTCWKEFKHPLAGLFIDGAHDLATVELDIMGWTPKVQIGGYVLFHDYAPKASDIEAQPSITGVRQAVDKWAWVHSEWQREELVDSLLVFRRK